MLPWHPWICVLERFRRMFPLDPALIHSAQIMNLWNLRNANVASFYSSYGCNQTTISPLASHEKTCHCSTMSVSLKVALQVRGAWVGPASRDLAESARNLTDLPRSPASDLALLYSRAWFWIPRDSGVLMYLSLKYSIGILA